MKVRVGALLWYTNINVAMTAKVKIGICSRYPTRSGTNYTSDHRIKIIGGEHMVDSGRT